MAATASRFCARGLSRIGAPAPDRRIAEILYLDPRLAQPLDQARGAQRGRRLLLAGRERARAGGYTEESSMSRRQPLGASALKRFMFSVIATSVGRRSIEEAPKKPAMPVVRSST